MVETEKRTAAPVALGVNSDVDAGAEYLHGNLRQYDPGFGCHSAYCRVLQLGIPLRYAAFRLPVPSSRAVSLTMVYAKHRVDDACANLHSGSCRTRFLSASLPRKTGPVRGARGRKGVTQAICVIRETFFKR